MATITLPLHELELAERKTVSILSDLDRDPPNSVALTHDLHEIVESTNQILRELNDSKIQVLSGTQLRDLATKLENVVALRSKMLSRLKSLPLSIAETDLAILEQQCERLDSLAETFRMGADPATRDHLLKLTEEAGTETETGTRTNWRDFVGSLHD